MIPPSFCYLKFHPQRWGWWLPFFLLWPLLLLLVLLVLPFWLLAGLFLVWFPAGRAILAAPVLVYELFCSLRGLTVKVQDGLNDISIKLI
ncbi:MAG: hypothetical protein AB1439_05000 [candidate division FCPU426 bacterium]